MEAGAGAVFTAFVAVVHRVGGSVATRNVARTNPKIGWANPELSMPQAGMRHAATGAARALAGGLGAATRSIVRGNP